MLLLGLSLDRGNQANFTRLSSSISLSIPISILILFLVYWLCRTGACRPAQICPSDHVGSHWSC